MPTELEPRVRIDRAETRRVLSELHLSSNDLKRRALLRSLCRYCGMPLERRDSRYGERVCWRCFDLPALDPNYHA